MSPYPKFDERHGPGEPIGPYPVAELATMSKKLPAELVSFLTEQGRRSFSRQTLWTTCPSDFRDILSWWGLDGSKCQVVFRTALGGLVYYTRKQFHSLDSLTGTVNCLNDEIYTLVNVYLTFDFLLEDTFHLSVVEKRDDLPPLGEDEIYALVPALAFGGSLETSRLEVVKMREHLAFLAELAGNKLHRL